MKQLGVSFGSIFLLFSHESSGGSTFIAAGGNPRPRLLMTALKIHYTRLRLGRTSLTGPKMISCLPDSKSVNIKFNIVTKSLKMNIINNVYQLIIPDLFPFEKNNFNARLLL